MIKPIIGFCLCLAMFPGVGPVKVTPASLPGQHADVPSTRKEASFPDSLIVAKNFYLLSLLRQHPEVDALVEHAMLQKNLTQKNDRVQAALRQCADIACLAQPMQWNEQEIDEIGDALVKASEKAPSFKKLIGQLRTSGRYKLYEPLSDTAMIRRVWTGTALGINRIIRVYLLGERPQYYRIDSISFSVHDPAFIKRVVDEVEKNSTIRDNKSAFYEMPLAMAMMAMRINNRDEAARYEPLSGVINQAAFRHARSLQWSSYKYSAILVPGHGPATAGVAIDGTAEARCRMAVEEYRKGLAPFIVVSGGHVHPFQTPYCEAIEMKSYLVTQLKVPEEAILVEPQARHTTTNLRNANRILFQLGVPADIPVLVTSDSSQCSYITTMQDRCLKDLGYLPFDKIKLISPERVEYVPVTNSLQSNAHDPLDP